MDWAEIDAALGKLRELLEPRIGRAMTRQVFANLMMLRESRDATPIAVLQAIAQIEQGFAKRPPIAAPFGLGDCRAIHDAAIRKLWDVSNRVRWKRPLRGMTEVEATALIEHADALAPAFSEDEVAFRIRIAYHNVFTFQHHLIFGEPHDRNDPTPVGALAAAAAAQDLPPGGRHHFVPVSVVPERGVIWALGTEPSEQPEIPWSPAGFMFIPKRGRSLRLDDIADLRSFFVDQPLEITAKTLASLLWLLAAPFPFDSRLELDHAILERFEPLEAEVEAKRFVSASAAEILRPEPPAAPPTLAELRLRFEPVGVELRYRPGKLEVF